MACMNFIWRVVRTSYLTSWACNEQNTMFIQRAQ